MKLTNSQHLMRDDGLPVACFLTPEARAKAWKGRALTTIFQFARVTKDESPETAAFRAQEEERRRLKSLAAIGRMKARFETKKIDYSKMRWDARRNRFVPLDGQRPVAPVESPPVAQVRRPATKAPVAQTATDGPRVTKDNAEAVARLNSVWKPEYEKLRGTGRIVMTVGNMLRGLVKRGGEVKWQ